MEHAEIVAVVAPEGQHTIHHSRDVVECVMGERSIVVEGVVATAYRIAELLEAHLFSGHVLVGSHAALTEVITAKRLVFVRRVVLEGELRIRQGHLRLADARLVAMELLHGFVGLVLDQRCQLRQLFAHPSGRAAALDTLQDLREQLFQLGLGIPQLHGDALQRFGLLLQLVVLPDSVGAFQLAHLHAQLRIQRICLRLVEGAHPFDPRVDCRGSQLQHIRPGVDAQP